MYYFSPKAKNWFIIWQNVILLLSDILGQRSAFETLLSYCYQTQTLKKQNTELIPLQREYEYTRECNWLKRPQQVQSSTQHIN